MSDTPLTVVVEVSTEVDNAEAFNTAMMLEWGGNVIDSSSTVPEGEEDELVIIRYEMIFDEDEVEGFLAAFVNPMSVLVEGIEEIPHVISNVEYQQIPDTKLVRDVFLQHAIFGTECSRYVQGEYEAIVKDMADAILDMRTEVTHMMEQYSALFEYVEGLKKITNLYGILEAITTELGMEELLEHAKEEQVH